MCADQNFPLLSSGLGFLSLTSSQVSPILFHQRWHFGNKESRVEDLKSEDLMVNVILMHLWLLNFCPKSGGHLHPQVTDLNVYLSPKLGVIISKCSWNDFPQSTVSPRSNILIHHWAGMIFLPCGVCMYMSLPVYVCEFMWTTIYVWRCVNSSCFITIFHVLLWRHDCYFYKINCIGVYDYNSARYAPILEKVINGKNKPMCNV